jgi:hypothetical protein
MRITCRQITTRQPRDQESSGLLNHGYQTPTEQEKQALTTEFHINPEFTNRLSIKGAATGAIAEANACIEGGPPLDRLIRFYETVYLDQLSQYLRRAAGDATAKKRRASSTILRGMSMAFKLHLKRVKHHGHSEVERMEKLLQHYKELEVAVKAEPDDGSKASQKLNRTELVWMIVLGLGLMDLVAYLFPSKWLGPPWILAIIRGQSYVDEWRAVHGVPFAKASQVAPKPDHREEE